jgi:uncharacterized membrane protein (DUF4010 family)
MNLSQWKPYLISLAVGLLVGIERESSKTNPKALGVRTFLLLSLLGVIAGDLESLWLSASVALFALGLIFTSYVIQVFSKQSQVHLGLTTEFAAGVVFLAGVLAHESPVVTATIGPVVALILISKASLHRFTQRILPSELKAAITVLLIAVAVVDLTPDQTVDPWGLLNPRKFGYLVLTLATLELASYILLKLIGEKKGSLVVGFLGGLVSSTAILISTAKQAAKTPDSSRTFLSTAIVAQLASLVELMAIVLLTSKTIFLSIAPAIVAGSILMSISIFAVGSRKPQPSSELVLKSPLDWKGVFRLSVIFGLLLALVSAAEHWIGHEAVYSLSFLAGLFELQGISLVNATLFTQSQVSLSIASQCILLAVIGSLVAKATLSWFFGRNQFAALLNLILIPTIGLVAFVGWLTLYSSAEL